MIIKQNQNRLSSKQANQSSIVTKIQSEPKKMQPHMIPEMHKTPTKMPFDHMSGEETPLDLRNGVEKPFASPSGSPSNSPLQHKLQQKYYCDQCSKPFKNESILKWHILRAHPKNQETEMIKCNYCEKKFRTHNEAFNHKLESHLTCKQCDENFQNSQSYIEHLQWHKSGGSTPSKVSPLKRSQSEHLSDEIPKKKRKKTNNNTAKNLKRALSFETLPTDKNYFKCEICFVEIKAVFLYQEHLVKEHKLRGFPCAECNSVFARDSTRKKHEKDAHIKILKRKSSEYASASANISSSASSSIRHNAKNIVKASVSTKIKDKASASPSDNTASNSTYIGDRASASPSDDSTSTNGASSPEILDGIDVIRVQCEICKFVMKDNFSYQEHLRHEHNKRAYQCSICERLLVSEDAKINHEKAEHGMEASLRCLICGKSFARKYHLERHVKNKACKGLQDHKCQHCDKKFSTTGQFEKHIKHHCKTLLNSEVTEVKNDRNDKDDKKTEAEAADDKERKGGMFKMRNCRKCKKSYNNFISRKFCRDCYPIYCKECKQSYSKYKEVENVPQGECPHCYEKRQNSCTITENALEISSESDISNPASPVKPIRKSSSETRSDPTSPPYVIPTSPTKLHSILTSPMKLARNSLAEFNPTSSIGQSKKAPEFNKFSIENILKEPRETLEPEKSKQPRLENNNGHTYYDLAYEWLHDPLGFFE